MRKTARTTRTPLDKSGPYQLIGPFCRGVDGRLRFREGRNRSLRDIMARR